MAILLALGTAYALWYDVFGETTDQAELCASTANGTEVSVVGFVKGDDMQLDAESAFPVLVSEKFRVRDGFHAHVPYGTSPNTMFELPMGWSEDDIRITLSDGSEAGYNDRLVFTGVLTVDPDAPPARQCYLAEVAAISRPD